MEYIYKKTIKSYSKFEFIEKRNFNLFRILNLKNPESSDCFYLKVQTKV